MVGSLGSSGGGGVSSSTLSTVTRRSGRRTYPLFQTPEEAAKQAVENDVHVVGVSSLAAGHLTLVPQIIAELKKLGREDIVVVVGGVIPAQDYDQLYRDGAAAIFGPGTPVATAAIKILEILAE